MDWATIFSNNNGAAIIGIIGVATGAVIALISTTVTTFFNNKASNKRQHEQHQYDQAQNKNNLLRERAEELYELFDKPRYNYTRLFSTVSKEFSRWASLSEAAIDHKKIMRDASKVKQDNNQYYGRRQMIVNAYFPEISNLYKEYLNARDSVTDAITTFQSTYMQNGEMVRGDAEEMTRLSHLVTEAIKNEEASAQAFSTALHSVISVIGDIKQ